MWINHHIACPIEGPRTCVPTCLRCFPFESCMCDGHTALEEVSPWSPQAHPRPFNFEMVFDLHALYLMVSPSAPAFSRRSGERINSLGSDPSL